MLPQKNCIRCASTSVLIGTCNGNENLKLSQDSVDALDKTRADAQTLLCEDATEANTKKLHTFDKLASMQSMHLQALECALAALPSVIEEMEEHTATASRFAARSARKTERSRSRSW